MATKSILKHVDIKKKDLGASFVCALENAEKKSSKIVELKKPLKQLHREQIRLIFGE